MFDNPQNRAKGMKEWLSHYPECNRSEESITTDMTPDDIASPQAARTIAAWYGDLKRHIQFVVILRDPVARIHSAFWNGKRDHWWHGRATNMSFYNYVVELLNTTVDPLGENYKKRPCETNSFECMGPFAKSRYAEQLGRYISELNANQFTVALYKQVFEDLWSFTSSLGLPCAIPKPLETPRITPAGSHSRLDEDVDPALEERFRTFIEAHAGPSVVAEQLAQMRGARLFGYMGYDSNRHDIEQWLRYNW